MTALVPQTSSRRAEMCAAQPTVKSSTYSEECPMQCDLDAGEMRRVTSQRQIF